MARHREAREIAEERYTLWAMNHLRNPGSIYAAFALIRSCVDNKQFEDALIFSREAMFMISDMADNFIPADKQPEFLADGSYYLALALFRLSLAGGIPPEEKQKAGEEAIKLARKALGLHTRLNGIESDRVALDMATLADALNHFNNRDDDEVLRLLERAISITARGQGTVSMNMGSRNSLGTVPEQVGRWLPSIWTDAWLI